MHRLWFEGVGGRWVADEDTATAANGHEIAVCGREELDFEIWSTRFVELVRVAEDLPSKVLVGSRFGVDKAWF